MNQLFAKFSPDLIVYAAIIIVTLIGFGILNNPTDRANF